MEFNLPKLCFRKIIKQEIPAFRREFFKAFIQTLSGKTRLLRSFRGNCHLVNIQMNSLFSQRFSIDVFGDAVTIRGLVFDFFFEALQDYAVDGFIREFISKAAVSQRKKSAQTKSQALVLLTRALIVRTKPREKAQKLFPGNFIFEAGDWQLLRPRSGDGEF